MGSLTVCASHAKVERDKETEASKPKKEYKGLQRGGLVKKVSEKRKEQNDVYSIMREKFLNSKKRCECCGEAVENRDPTKFLEVHHMKGRTNELLLDRQYWLAVCSPCHRHITDDSAWAIKEGYSLPRNGKG